MKKIIAIIALLFAGILIGGGLVFGGSESARKKVSIAAVDKMHDVAVRRMQGNEGGGDVAAEFINIPIGAREIAPGIIQATGVGNATLITTDGKDVLFDTGLATQVPKQMKALRAAVPDLQLSHIVLSHSHADHMGGAKFWHEDGVKIVAHSEYEEEQRYLTELQDYFWGRNRTLFPFMPEKPPAIGLIAYGGVVPDVKVPNGRPLKFTQGGRRFELHALPGAEGADNLLLWLPGEKILLSGDFFGPIFPQFPNIFTMRGEKIRKPIEYVRSLDQIIAMRPKIIVPSHKNPISDQALIDDGLMAMRDAVQYVHDATVKGMNDGKTVYQLMNEIRLPAHLQLSQVHGKVSWAVKSIWEYYATWFHFDRTAELYGTPPDATFADIAALAGPDKLAEQAAQYLSEGFPVKALQILEIALAGGEHAQASFVKKSALEELLARAKTGHKNSYEVYWLQTQLRNLKPPVASDEQ